MKKFFEKIKQLDRRAAVAMILGIVAMVIIVGFAAIRISKRATETAPGKEEANKELDEAVAAGDELPPQEINFSDEDLSEALSDDVTDVVLSLDDAKNIVADLLTGTGCTYSCYSYVAKDVDDDIYYLFYVSKKGKKYNELLAIHAESGYPFTFDEGAGEILPYSSFPEYNPGMDENIVWSGKYMNKDEYELIIEEEDPGSFAFTVVRGDTKLGSGYASEQSHVKATGTADDENLTFMLDAEKITILSDQKISLYAGVYNREK